MSKPDGGSAFPQGIFERSDGAVLTSADFSYGGLTLRDYFAGQAVVAIVPTAAAPCLHLPVADCRLVAETAYAIADAMLAERDK